MKLFDHEITCSFRTMRRREVKITQVSSRKKKNIYPRRDLTKDRIKGHLMVNSKIKVAAYFVWLPFY